MVRSILPALELLPLDFGAIILRGDFNTGEMDLT